uniref:Transmembrane protein 135 n=1 Tax=Ciona savignyi TaxID=51511 RepID=H2ZM34_CIOSA
MVIQSKPVIGLPTKRWTDSAPYTCYEIGHTWEPTCTGAFFDTMRDSLKFSLKVYTSFYFATALVKLRKKKYRNLKELRKILRDIIQSSIFLSANGVLFMGSFCVFRHLIGKFYGWHGLLCGFVAGYLSILIERKSRRGALALYLTNLATEIVYQSAKRNGLVQPIPNGEVLLFSAAAAGFMALYRQPGGLPESVQNLLQFFVEKKKCQELENKEVQTKKFKFCRPVWLVSQIFDQTPRHASCTHQSGCLGYVLKGAVPNFALGYGIEIILNLLQVLRGKKKFRHLMKFSKNSSLALFLGGFTSLFRISNCLLRWLFNKDMPQLFGAISGFVAGSSFYFYKSPTIALYVLFKLLEIVAVKLVKGGFLPDIPNIDCFIYATMLSIILHCACFGPQFMRPGYWKFICNVSGNKFPFMFRQLMLEFAPNATTLYPDFVPTLNRKYVRTPAVLKLLATHGKLL